MTGQVQLDRHHKSGGVFVKKNDFTGISKKHLKGLTLIELTIAVTVLAIGIAGIITVFHVGLSMSATANEITIAGIEAQLQMESLVGRPWIGSDTDLPLSGLDQDLDSVSPPVIWNTPFECSVGDLWVRLVYRPHMASTWDDSGTLRRHDWNNMESVDSDDFATEVDGDDPLPPLCDCLGIDDCGIVRGLGPIRSNLMSIRVTVYVYRTLADALAHNPQDPDYDPNASSTWLVRHSNIINVCGGIL